MALRLRALARAQHDDFSVAVEAADKIERLAAMLTEAHDKWEFALNEVDRLRAALAPLNLVKSIQRN